MWKSKGVFVELVLSFHPYSLGHLINNVVGFYIGHAIFSLIYFINNLFLSCFSWFLEELEASNLVSGPDNPTASEWMAVSMRICGQQI